MRVTPSIHLKDDELEFKFIQSSGPGGQNVNRVATAVQLRFNAAASEALTAAVRERLYRLAGNRVTKDGMVIIDARRYRNRERNRQDAVCRLMDLIRQAAVPPKRRVKTKPSRSARRRRLDRKRRRSETKQRRGRIDPRTLE